MIQVYALHYHVPPYWALDIYFYNVTINLHNIQELMLIASLTAEFSEKNLGKQCVQEHQV